MDGFHYKLALVRLYLYQMLGPLFGSPQRSASLGCAYDWRPTVTATGDWANLSHRKMNNANKPQVYWELWPQHGPAYFLDAKGKTHGLPDSSGAGANKNRTMPLLSIMCDLSDLILISSSPQTKHRAAVSGTLLEPFFFFYIPANLEWVTRQGKQNRSAFELKPWSCSDQWHELKKQSQGKSPQAVQ